ncbi:MAG: betaine/proline/choline family ABC transporter ATP-binding protein [Herpetosiphon sp.]
MPLAIVAQAVTKQFGTSERPSVNGCSFAVEAGEFIVLLGPSGCGKTTLLKMINRLYEPSSGSILFRGQDIAGMPVTTLRRQIGYVIQQTGLFPHLRVADNVAVVPRLLGWDRQRIDGRVDELLALVGLPRDYRERYPRQLSGGEQQRVGIARALAADPEVLLMDEPFGAIDALTRTRLQDELIEIQQRLRKTILFVTHDVEEALRLADRMIVMQEGKILQFATPVEILSAPATPFVRQLVGADDMLRRLGVLSVGHFAQSAVGADAGKEVLPTIRSDESLRAALALLLQGNETQLRVVDGEGRLLGSLTWEAIRAALRTGEQPLWGQNAIPR